MVVSSKPGVVRAACQSTDACDYPVVLGNDQFYGGMGGKFMQVTTHKSHTHLKVYRGLDVCTNCKRIVTASPHNGPLVLRHELGHSIIDVGEEYDGGFNYSGVNSARDASSSWAQWYSGPSTEPKIQQTSMPLQGYPWALLNMSQSWSQTFISAGIYDSHVVEFSVSGVAASGDLKVEIDGSDLGWEVNAVVGLDRWIYTIKTNEALTPGAHEVAFTLLNEERQGSAQLCHVKVLEYGNDEG